MITYLGTDIISQKDYFEQLVKTDEQLQSFLFEAGEEVTGMNEATKAPGFAFPALILFMPFVDIDDNGHGLIDAEQDNAFAILVKPVDRTEAARNQATADAQLMAFRIISQLRKDAKAGRFRLPEKRRWRVRPMSAVGQAQAYGVMVDFQVITNANALVGFSS
jgi:hypothetical protein